jgi:hypothetical protein
MEGERTHIRVSRRLAPKMGRSFASPVGDRFVRVNHCVQPILGLGHAMRAPLESVLFAKIRVLYRSINLSSSDING